MKIVGVSGSPRKNENSEKVLEKALSIAKSEGFETVAVKLSEKKVNFCLACEKCITLKKCVQENDDFNAIAQLLEEANGIIIVSPTYFGCVSAQLKALFDRGLSIRRKDFALKDKFGIGIVIGRSRNGGQEFVMQAIHSWMHIQGIIPVSDDSHFGGILVAPIEVDEIGLKTLKQSVKKLCRILKKVKK